MRRHLSFMAIVAGLAATATMAADARVKDAERLAAHGELSAARDQYQALHDELVTSGATTSAALHYNLGTLALSLDDVGPAVLHLTAATRRDPIDDDAHHNLEVALARRADQVSSTGSQAVGARLPAGPVQLAFGLALGLLGVVLAISGLGAGRFAAAVRRALGPVAVMVLVTGALAALRHHADGVDVAVTMLDTEARPQPEASAKGFTIHPGLTGVVVAEQQGYLRLRLENGIDVWVEHAAVRLVP